MRLLFSAIALVSLLLPAPVSAGPVCDFWKKASEEQQKARLVKIADGSYAPVYEKEWPTIRRCVDSSAASILGDVGSSCSREGDYSAGFVMGFFFHLAVTKCLVDQEAKP